MENIELEFTNRTLYITMIGMVSKEQLTTLARKIFYIKEEYGVESIKVDITNCLYLEEDSFLSLLDMYHRKYNRELTIVG